MHFTIQFDHQFGAGAVKVHNVPTKRFLPRKPYSLKISTPAKPATIFLRLALDSVVVPFEAQACTTAISQQNLKPKPIAATRDST
jgi:hypothetical protein